MTIYCTDANFFITAWSKYYSMSISADYWDLLEQYATKGKLFIPMEAYEELMAIEDDLCKWLVARKNIFVKEIDEKTQATLKDLFKLPEILTLIDTNKKKNKADPFVIAYGKAHNATIVTNDGEIIKICNKIGLKNIRDYEFVSENKIKFSVA